MNCRKDVFFDRDAPWREMSAIKKHRRYCGAPMITKLPVGQLLRHEYGK